jgi:uncharacterized protein DUF2852
MPFVYFGFLIVMAVWLFWALVWAIMLLAWPIALLIAGVLGWRTLGRRWSASWRSGSCRKARMQAPRGNGSVPESNSAFAAYRQEAMNRIDEEQEKFREFLQRLRRSRDRQEFDQYMAARRSGRPAPAIIDGDARAG